MSDLLVSYIRTYVPLAVGGFLGWLLTIGVEVPEVAGQNLEVGVVGLAVAVYYAVARSLERRWPKLGALLGKKAEPHYIEPGKRIKGQD